MKAYFEGINDINQIRRAYRELCLQLHPDKGGRHEDFVSMQNEYEEIVRRAAAAEAGRANQEERAPHFTCEGEREIMEMLEKLMNVPGIIVEICGSWLWVSGETYKVVNRLGKDGLGFKFSGQKKRWYWTPYNLGSWTRGRYSMKKIYEKYGCEVVKSEAEETKELAYQQ